MVLQDVAAVSFAIDELSPLQQTFHPLRPPSLYITLINGIQCPVTIYCDYEELLFILKRNGYAFQDETVQFDATYPVSFTIYYIISKGPLPEQLT